jgi:hypothetical protein
VPGYPQNQEALDARLGELVVRLRTTMNQIDDLNTDIQRIDGTVLIGPGYNYSSDDVVLMKQTWASLAVLAQIYRGAASLPSPVNFENLGIPYRGFVAS